MQNMKKMNKFYACNASTIPTAVVLLVVSSNIMFMVVPQATAQDSSCLYQLAPCLNYLNGTREVPDTCCDPLKNIIKSDQQCLCSMMSNQGSNQAEQAGININEAQQLPLRCGLRVNPLSCIADNAGGGTAGGGGSSNNRNSDGNNGSNSDGNNNNSNSDGNNNNRNSDGNYSAAAACVLPTWLMLSATALFTMALQIL
ncbi:hypothetical protein Tsubulata_037899 [Turnera subulata]|uniref:Bifunctional inhibitor/plant lipid transfer protein/seed storage helical domain-containing protein n=1 Tax=Turnera subulata TaxID=218843 RepID=A0A9Q0FGV9_9ROSI|nr:hypothetical protein Tsubulata_037899 [Turnera subulata]